MSMMTATDTRPLLDVRDLHVTFHIRSEGDMLWTPARPLHAVGGVDFTLYPGETLGIVGESGCGKSTLARALIGLVPGTGTARWVDGADILNISPREMMKYRSDIQMVFQDPLASLNPRMTVGQIIAEPLTTHHAGLSRDEVRRRVKEIMEKVGLLANQINRYPHEFSGGQCQRIGIARALIVQPKLIICDEPVSALDVSVQAQVVNLLEKLQHEFGLTYVVIAHDLAVVRHISDRVGVMYLGRIVEEADADVLYATPLHPYTIALMSAIPIPDPEVEDGRERILLRGDLPSPANPPSGCRFHTRCPYRQPTRCDDEVPELRVIDGHPGHRVSCHWAEQILAEQVTPAESLVVEAAVPE